jgi:HlyD family secretion protein
VSKIGQTFGYVCCCELVGYVFGWLFCIICQNEPKMTDRPISEKQQKLRKLKKASFWAVGILIVFVLGRMLVGWTESSVNASRLIIVKPEIKSIQTGFRATGIVRSTNTKTLVAPFNCTVEKILINRGESVKNRTIIMELSTLELEKNLLQLNDEKLLMIQEKAQLQKDLVFHQNNNKLDQQHDSIQLHNYKTELEQLNQLYRIGGTPYERVKQAQMKLQMAQIENKQSKLQLSKQLQDKAFEINQLDVKIRLHNQKIADVEAKIQQAMLSVPYSGVIQKINVTAGENVSQGMSLATIVSSDQIEVACETGASYSDELFLNQIAELKFGENTCRAKVTQIDQTLSNNNIRFLLEPEKSSSLKLNQSVQVQLFTQLKDSVLCIPKRNYYSGPGAYNLFVVRNGEAKIQNVKLGLSNFEFVEVISDNLKKAEIIIEGVPDQIKSNSFKLKY